MTNDPKIIPAERRDMLLANSRGGVHLSIDGNAGCALLGPNIQEGEAEFVVIDKTEKNDGYKPAAWRAVVRAKRALEKRCYPDGEYRLPYYVGNCDVFQ